MSIVYVGSDVVDLGRPRTRGRAADDRFVRRVYAPAEQAAIRNAPDPNLELWAMWAAKEAGFKVVSKLIGIPPPFVHAGFEVSWSESTEPDGAEEREVVRRGHVTYEHHRVEIQVELQPGSVHAVGFPAPAQRSRIADVHPTVQPLDAPAVTWSGSLEDLRLRFTEEEFRAVYSRPSAAVRLGARADLAQRMGIDERRLQIVCDPGPRSRRPPRVMLDGSRAAADVSLSHDGRWIAWVLWLDPHAETG